MRDDLRAALTDLPILPARKPIDQLIKSPISGLTYDAVSLRAFDRLVAAYPCWADVAAASCDEVSALIADVTHADDKAGQTVAALRLIAADHPDFDLEFLQTYPLEDALAWLERLPGVGRKVAASALNFSTLERPAFVADTTSCACSAASA